MRTDLFQHELTKTTALFGRKDEAMVQFDMKGARTDGKTVYLPVLAQGKEVSEEVMDVMRGYVDHEAGHLRHSDMKAITKKYEEWGRSGQGWVSKLHNGIEDVWLERRVMKDYAGSERHLRAVSTEVNRKTLKALDAGELDEGMMNNPAAVIGVAITWEGRKGYGGPENEELIGRLHPVIAEKLAGYVERTLACKNSRETLALAEVIAAELREEFGKPEEKEKEKEKPEEKQDGEGPAPEGDEEQDGEAHEGQDEGEEPKEDEGKEGRGEDSGEADAGEDEDEDEEEEEQGSSTKKGTGEEAPEERKAPEIDEDVEAMEPELSKAVEEAAHEAGVHGGEHTDYAPATTANDRVWHRSTLAQMAETVGKDRRKAIERIFGAGSAESYDRLVAGMTGEISVMRRGLERALMAKLTRDWNRGQEAGRLDTRRLVGALAGRPNVFKTPAERGEIDTAVSILVDLSGSMAKMDRDGPARDATIGLVEAMVKAGVSVEVVGMSMESYDEDGAATAWRTSGGRWEPLDLLVFKAFEDRLFEAKPALVAIGAACHRYCNNCDGETLMLTYDRLRRRPERKKVLFVLSDGEPVCEPYVHTRREVLDKHLKDSIAYVEAQGVEVVGVGIQSQSVRKFYPRHMVIDDLGDLAKQTMGLLGKLLLERPGRRSA